MIAGIEPGLRDSVERVPVSIATILGSPLECSGLTGDASSVVTAIGNPVPIVVREGPVEDLPVVDDAVAVAVGGPLDCIGVDR